MSSSTNDADEELVYELADEFVQRHQNGEAPSVSEYCSRHPELSAKIRKLFPTLVALEGSKRPPPKQNLERVGTYELLREIGRGGMGVVYEARHETLGRRVAVKVLPQRLAIDQRALARFHREARAIAKLHHSNIVPLYDVGADEGQRYFAMQLISGKSLDRALQDARSSAATQSNLTQSGGSTDQSESDRSDVERRLSELRALTLSGSRAEDSDSSRKAMFVWVAKVGAQIADAMQYAHSHGIVHRDVKPSNILIDDSGTAWLSDFGLAKTDEEELTQTGDFVGTVRYMSPERFHGECDARADIYGLGLTLYEMLAMRPAFSEKDRLSLMEQIRRFNLPRLRDLNPNVPRDLETIVQKACDPESKRRYLTASLLADDLRNFIEDRPIRARRQSSFERFLRWCRRNKGLAAALATAVLSLLVLIGVLGVTSVRESRLRATETQTARDLRRNLYYAEMNHAGALAAGGLGFEQIELLTSAWLPSEEPQPSEADLRGWEWYYLRSLLVDEVRKMGGGGADIWSIEWSPDQAHIVSAAFDGVVIWNADDGTVARQLEHPNRSWRAVWSPDGKQLATSCDDGCLRVWDVATWKLAKKFQAHPGHIGCVDWSPDGKRLFSVSDRGVAKFWDVASGQQIGVPLKHKHQSVRGGTWSPDGRFVATGTSQGDTIYVWDTSNIEATPRTLKGHFSPNWLAWNSTGDRLASSGEKGAVMIWDIETGELVRNFTGHVGEALRLSWSPDDRFVASASRDASVRIWDVEKGELARLFRTRENIAFCTSWDATGRWLLAGCANGIIRMWDMEAVMSDSFAAHQSSINHLAWTPDRSLRSMGRDALKVWDLGHGAPGSEYVLPGHLSESRDFSPDASMFIAKRGSTDYVWKAENLAENLEAVFELGPQTWRGVGWSPDSRTLTIVDKGKRITHDARTWDVLSEGETGFDEDSRSFLSHDNTWMIGASASEVHVVNVKDLHRRCRLDITRDQLNLVATMRFSPDGSRIAGVLGHEVLLWDAETGEHVGTLTGQATASQYTSWWTPGRLISWSPDGHRIATAGAEGTVRIWNPNDFQSVLTLNAGKAVTRVLWHPNGKMLVGGTVDGHIHIWDASLGYEDNTLDDPR